jgi:hypothetical protein
MITNTDIKNIFNGNGTSRTFQYTFDCESASNIKIYVKREDDEAESLISSAYSIDIYNGTVTYPIESASEIPVLTANDTIAIVRVTPQTQNSSWSNGGAFDANTIEDAFDKVTRMINEIGYMASRLPQAPNTIEDADIEDYLKALYKGDTGPQGPQGEQGIQGPKGETGSSMIGYYSYVDGDNIKSILESTDEKYQNIDFRGIYAELSGITLSNVYKNIRNLNVYVSEKERLMNIVDSHITFIDCEIITNNPTVGSLINISDSVINLNNTNIVCQGLEITDWTMFKCNNARITAKKSEFGAKEIYSGNQEIKNIKIFDLNANVSSGAFLLCDDCRFVVEYTSDDNNGADIIYLNPLATCAFHINLTQTVFSNYNKGGSYANDLNVRLEDDIHLRGNLIGYIYVRNETLSDEWQPNTPYSNGIKLINDGNGYQTVYEYVSADTIEEDIENGYLLPKDLKLGINVGNSISDSNNRSFCDLPT